MGMDNQYENKEGISTAFSDCHNKDGLKNSCKAKSTATIIYLKFSEKRLLGKSFY